MGMLEAIVLSVIAASTPLLLAAAGELVVERSGVLNLGVEGMMIMGAACGFAGAWLTGSTFVGALCRHRSPASRWRRSSRCSRSASRSTRWRPASRSPFSASACPA